MSASTCSHRELSPFAAGLNAVQSVLLLLLLLVAALVLPSATAGRNGAFINYTEKAADCKDLSPWCPVWAKDGECTKNPHLPKDTCPLSCGLCAAPDVVPMQEENGTVLLHTSFGEIPIKLLTDIAPSSCALVHRLAQSKGCTECHFYRNEVPPQSGDGPPYGLLQGSLLGLAKLPQSEGKVMMKRGHVAFIPGTVEFFIAAMDHPEWGDAHIVWGWVHNMTTVDAILKSPYHEYKHPQYGTVMRMLDEDVKIGISYQLAQLPELGVVNREVELVTGGMTSTVL